MTLLLDHPPAGPHARARIATAGAPLATAAAVVILIHGRGSDADDMLGLARHLGRADLAVLAPEAVGNTWYPGRFLEPVARNEPWLGSALALVDGLVGAAAAAGHPAKRILIGGFSQGACLALEYAWRHPGRIGAAVGLSGGLIGPLGSHAATPGSFDGLPVFLGCNEADPHIPLDHVGETAALFRQAGAVVDERIYPGFGHAVNRDELTALADIVEALVKA